MLKLNELKHVSEVLTTEMDALRKSVKEEENSMKQLHDVDKTAMDSLHKDYQELRALLVNYKLPEAGKQTSNKRQTF